ncbi:MAG: flippase-like domain-containing protein [Roseburia sp.]|nr:flippase-like domain-containing protein [Roseburia sp.]
MSKKKKVAQVLFFLAVMGLTFWAVLHNQNLPEIWQAVRSMKTEYFLAAMLLGIFFVSMEGFMIFRLLSGMNGKSSLFRCIQYSFIGFFYSGITPSATGGQPMQLYYMSKDGNRASDSTVVLMTVALYYKLVLVLIGVGILLGWNRPLRHYLGGYYGLYLLGLALNTLLVLLILGVMLFPKTILKTANAFEAMMIRLGLWKPSPKRREKVAGFVDSYGNAVSFLKNNKSKLLEILILTFLQRCSVFFLTYLVYLGFGLTGTDAGTVMFLQAAIYIAVDMLPVPGAQGITEAMYQGVYRTVFTGGYLMPSMLVSRGINFYFLLIISLLIIVWNCFAKKSS